MARKVGRDKERMKANARAGKPEKWELPILFDRRAALAKVLAEDVPGGTIWANNHEAGAPVIWKERVRLRDGGTVMYTIPLPSELLLRAAEPRLKRAGQLRIQVLKTASNGGDLYPEHRTITDHDLVFDFFQEAMSGIALVYAALNNFGNEHIPIDFSMEFKGRTRGRDFYINSTGIKFRLSKVLHCATSKPNLMTARPDLWDRICRLKALRDGIEHANGGIEAFKTDIDVDESLFALLFNEDDLFEFVTKIRDIIDLYRDDEHGPRTIQSGGHSAPLMSARAFKTKSIS